MILVTGATGLVGTHLLGTLLQEKKQLRALYRTKAKKAYTHDLLLRSLSNEQHHLLDAIDWVQADITDIPAVSEAFEGVTHVYHCAAKISFDPREYKVLRKTNIDGTANIVNLCMSKSVQKLCYVSSIATIGEGIEHAVLDEQSEWNSELQNSVYAITKYGAEMEVWRGIYEGLNAVIVNPGIIIGAGFFDSGSGALFKSLYAGMKYYTPGITGYVSIEDVTEIMCRLMNGPYTAERYILVGENLSFKQAFSMIASALQKREPYKEATPALLTMAYYAQKVGNRLLGTKQSIFRSSIRSAFSVHTYANEKITQALDYTFIPIEKSIQDTAAVFLETR